MKSFLEKVFGSYSAKEVKRIEPTVDKIIALDKTMQSLSDSELKQKTNSFI